MGRDKRQLRLGDMTLLEQNLAFLRTIFPAVALSVRDARQVPPGLTGGAEIVPDIVPGSPLAGLASVLTRFREPCFALAADIAFPDPAAVHKVLAAFRDVDVALPVAEGHLEPLHAVYGPGCLPHIERLLAAGARSILDLYTEVRVATVAFGTVEPFFNLNTPEDWEEAARRSAVRGRTPSLTTKTRFPRGTESRTIGLMAHGQTDDGQTSGGATPTSQPALVAIVGKSDSGKTTLIEKLIPELVGLGLRVGTVKHDAHSFEIDHPGKDSWRHGQAGAEAYVIASPERLAFISRLQDEMPLAEIVRRFFAGFDLVVCEGYKRTAPHRVELFRVGAGHSEPLCGPGEAVALVTDADLGHEHRFGLEDAPGLARFLDAHLDLLREY